MSMQVVVLINVECDHVASIQCNPGERFTFVGGTLHGAMKAAKAAGWRFRRGVATCPACIRAVAA
jgi:hypothetical protein